MEDGRARDQGVAIDPSATSAGSCFGDAARNARRLTIALQSETTGEVPFRGCASPAPQASPRRYPDDSLSRIKAWIHAQDSRCLLTRDSFMTSG